MQRESFIGRLFKQLFYLACVVGIGFFAYNNVGDFDGFSDNEDGGSNIGDSIKDRVNEKFGNQGEEFELGYPSEKQGDRPYAKYSEKSLEVVSKNLSEPHKAKGYSRDKFFIYDGNSWNKVKREESKQVGWKDFKDGNCNVRQAVLASDGAKVSYDKGCKSMKGTWTDVYGERDSSGKIVYKKSTNPRDYDIDHIVALSLAWRSGMDEATDKERNMLANDKANLVVSEKGINRSKGDQSIDEWTPPKNSKNYCDYADRYVYIKAKYSLNVTSEELKALEKIIGGCNAKDSNSKSENSKKADSSTARKTEGK